MSDFNQQQSIIVAGHICLDLTPRFPESALSTLIPGSLVRVDQMHCSVGGAVANTGLALHQLGVKTRLMGRIRDVGHMPSELILEVHLQNVDTSTK